jgi:hypothetical protein
MKRKFIQMREPPFDLIEVSADYSPPPRTVTDAALWNDRSYHGLQTTDGVAIDSRARHREYMAQRGLTTADDFKNEWASAADKRARYFEGQPGSGSISRHDIARAIHQLESNQSKRNR